MLTPLSSFSLFDPLKVDLGGVKTVCSLNGNTLALMYWLNSNYSKAIDHWMALEQKNITDKSFEGIDFYGHFILKKTQIKEVSKKIVSCLEEFIAISVDWTITFLSVIEGKG